MIKFIKMLAYDLRNKGDKLDFEWVRNVTLQKEDPESLNPGGLEQIKDAEIVFHSPLRRVVQCFPEISGIKMICLNSLREIQFDLREFCTEEEFLEKGSAIVRRQFKDFFIQDKLLIPRNQIFQEVKEVLKFCVESQVLRIAVVSHSFRLSMIEAFIETGGTIETNPSLVHDFIFDDKKRFNFGEGFTVDRSQILRIIG